MGKERVIRRSKCSRDHPRAAQIAVHRLKTCPPRWTTEPHASYLVIRSQHIREGGSEAVVGGNSWLNGGGEASFRGELWSKLEPVTSLINP